METIAERYCIVRRSCGVLFFAFLDDLQCTLWMSVLHVRIDLLVERRVLVALLVVLVLVALHT